MRDTFNFRSLLCLSRLSVLAAALVAGLDVADGSAVFAEDRLERRAEELAIGDPVLDPRWPELETRQAPTVSDSAGSVEHEESDDPGEEEDSGSELTPAERSLVYRYILEGRSLYEALELLRVEPLIEEADDFEDDLNDEMNNDSLGEEYEDPTDW